MSYRIRVHFNNSQKLDKPYLWHWHPNSSVVGNVASSGSDAFGPYFDLDVVRTEFFFKFKAGSGTAGPWEDPSLERFYTWLVLQGSNMLPNEVWCVGNNAFVYQVEPRAPEADSAAEFLAKLAFRKGVYVPDTGSRTGLGANVLEDGKVLFGLYHPNAARAYVKGQFNSWQAPGAPGEDKKQFIEMKRYRGYFGVPNIWLAVAEASPGQES